MNTNFKPLILSKGIINIMFKNCLTTTPNENSPVAFFRLKEFGYPEDSDPVFFDEKTLEDNKQNLFFLLGQLEKVHKTKQPILQPIDFTKNYTGERWTEDNVTVMKLIHLALAAEAITPFSAKSDITGVIISKVIPTLSPKDPNFPEWYEKYKKKF